MSPSTNMDIGAHLFVDAAEEVTGFDELQLA
jgi:hypothetical protein